MPSTPPLFRFSCFPFTPSPSPLSPLPPQSGILRAHPPRHSPAMIRSMTAFASAEADTRWGALAFELRSVNHRYLELNPRLPEELRAIEPVLRERVAARLIRGKVDVNLRFRPSDAAAGELRIDESVLG